MFQEKTFKNLQKKAWEKISPKFKKGKLHFYCLHFAGGGLFDFFNDELTTFKGKYPGFIFNFEK